MKVSHVSYSNNEELSTSARDHLYTNNTQCTHILLEFGSWKLHAIMALQKWNQFLVEVLMPIDG